MINVTRFLFFPPQTCLSGEVWSGRASSATSSPRRGKLSTASTTSECPAWRGTLPSAPSTPNSSPSSSRPAGEGLSSSFRLARFNPLYITFSITCSGSICLKGLPVCYQKQYVSNVLMHRCMSGLCTCSTLPASGQRLCSCTVLKFL